MSVISVLVAGCGGRMPVAGIGDSSVAREELSDTCGNGQAIEIDSLLDCMTVEELAGQVVMPALYADDSEITVRRVREYAGNWHIGGVVLLKGTVEGARIIGDTLAACVSAYSPSAGPLIAIDAEWGLAMRLKDTQLYPRNGRISPDAEETLLYEYGREVARECRLAGINMVLGPVLDVLPPGKDGVSIREGAGIGNRSFGSDARRVARLGTAYARGLEEGGVMSVAKHFPGHGSASGDSHRGLPAVVKTRAALDTTDLLPFREYVEAGLSGMMAGHLSVAALDDSGVPVTASHRVLTGLLREEMGFDGLIVTDAMNMAGADGHTCVDALLAGADIVLAPGDTDRELRGIVDAVRSGRLPASVLRDRVRRVLSFKVLFGRRVAGEMESGIHNQELALRLGGK